MITFFVNYCFSIFNNYVNVSTILTTIYWSFRIFCSFTFAVVFVFYFWRKYRKWRKFVATIDKIPGPPGNGIWGHTLLVMQLDKQRFEYGTYVLLYQMLSSANLIFAKERICKFWLGLKPLVILFTPEAVETILSSNVLTEKASEYNLLRPWLGEGLVTSNNRKWKARRKILTSAFHFRILQDFVPVINEHSFSLVCKLKQLIANCEQPIDIMPLMTLCTLDVICETAMGIKVNSQHKESEYVAALNEVTETVLFRLTRPWFWIDSIFFMTSHGKRFRRNLSVMKQFTVKVIEERKQEWLQFHSRKAAAKSVSSDELVNNNNQSANSVVDTDFFDSGKKRLAFLDLLLEHHLINNNLTIDDVREEVDTFMFAGHDTTAMAISWTLYLLALHSDIQEKVRQEIDAICDRKAVAKCENEMENGADGSVEERHNYFNADDLKEMKYTECVLKEVQRLYPTAPFIGREITHDTVISDYLIPRGTTCGILTHLLHHDSKIYPKPEIFDPNRFLPENCVGRHPYAYIPFSAGPRNCIGQKFAQMEQKIVVANVIRNFMLKAVDPRDKLVVAGEMVLRSRNGLRLTIAARDTGRMATVKKPKAIVFDVTGTVASKAFMSNSTETKTFMKTHILRYSQECFNLKEYRLAVNFAKAFKQVPGQKTPPPIADQMQPPNVQLDTTVNHFLWRLHNEGTSAPVAYFLLNMTSWGYEKGLLVTPVYEEVAATLKKWKESGIKLYVTLGSAVFLKRVFSRTSSGNLIGFIEGHMNLMVNGSKKDFSFLANLLKQKEEDILFITRFPQDARIARAAKIPSIIILRADFDPHGVELLKNKDKQPAAPEPKMEVAATSSSAEMTAESKVTSQDIREFHVVTRLDDIRWK